MCAFILFSKETYQNRTASEVEWSGQCIQRHDLDHRIYLSKIWTLLELRLAHFIAVYIEFYIFTLKLNEFAKCIQVLYSSDVLASLSHWQLFSLARVNIVFNICNLICSNVTLFAMCQSFAIFLYGPCQDIGNKWLRTNWITIFFFFFAFINSIVNL